MAHVVRAWRSSRIIRFVVLFGLLGTLTQVFLSRESGLPKSETPQTKTIGSLVSVEKLPEMAGEFCETDAANGAASKDEVLMAALEQRQDARASSLVRRTAGPAGAADSKDLSKLKPLRWIRDPYAAYSSIAVDPINNEVVMTDENLFQILVYDRLENTPPKAKLSEPKRVIAGLNTKIEFQCGLYIDPKDGSIYAVNNDTVDSLVIFDRSAKGDVKPNREINTPHGTFGVAVDEKAQEMYLTLQHDSAMVVFRKYAEGDESPLRLLQGDKTGLADPHGIALDTKDGLVFISNHGAVSDRHPRAEGQRGGRRGAQKQNWPLERAQAIPGSGRSLPPSIVVHSMKDQGNVPPIRMIQGPKTQFDWPTGLAVDEEKGELYVANDISSSILVFNVTDNGDVAPKRVIHGPKTNLRNPTGVWVDSKNHEVWAANFMNHSATVYPLGASGDVAPLRMIRSGPMSEPSLGIGNPHALAYDTKREQLLVPN
jgi:DNA-binding beta-propeller fold protein YncE